MSEQIYYHFVSASKRLRYDQSNTEVAVGLTLHTDQPISLCEYGYHASARPLDALKYAPEDAQWLCGVTLGENVLHDEDKSVSDTRTVVWMLNVRKLLVEFACWNCEQAFEAIRKIGLEPDARSIEAVRIVRLWLVGQASDEKVSAAARAAAYAARAAARAAAGAAYAAGAARAAAYAARAAAGAAAYAAGAARAAAYAAQNEQLEALIQSALIAQPV